MFLSVVEDIDIDAGRLSVKIVNTFVNKSPLSLREFVFFVDCDGETIKKRREYLFMAEWKVDGTRGRLEMVFIKRWGERMSNRLEHWRRMENKCNQIK